MIVVLIILIVIVSFVLIYVDRNLHRDKRIMKKVWHAGYVEKQVTLPNGTIINFGEGGEKNTTSLLLIHGQGQAWQDYDTVLPALAGKYHVYAVDCHGHGKSSHNPLRYSCKAMTEDFLWFAEKVIAEPCVVSGHSSGGIIAAAMAAGGSGIVSALVIEDSPFFCVEPWEMKNHNAVVWIDSFKMIHDFIRQNETPCLYEYNIKNSLVMSLFGNLKYKIAASAKKYVVKHPDQPLSIWYVPQAFLRGMCYGHMFDLKFAETFYYGSWFEGVSQEDILKGISCPCTYIKAKTGYLIDGKMIMDHDNRDLTDAVLCCANTDEDAERVRALIKDCHFVMTQSNDHLIHMKYPQLFVREIEAYIPIY